MECTHTLCAEKSQMHVAKTDASTVPMLILSFVRNGHHTHPHVKQKRIPMRAIETQSLHSSRRIFRRQLAWESNLCVGPVCPHSSPVLNRMG